MPPSYATEGWSQRSRAGRLPISVRLEIGRPQPVHLKPQVVVLPVRREICQRASPQVAAIRAIATEGACGP
jgi:hypothetical protein